MTNKSTATKAIRNLFYTGSRFAISASATICVSAVIARTLGPEQMGAYSYAMWLVGTGAVLANIGLPAALTKYIAEFMGRDDIPKAVETGHRLLRLQFLIAGGVSLIILCLSFVWDGMGNTMVLCAAIVLLMALQQSLIGALAGLDRFDRIALISLCVALLQIVSVCVAAALHQKVLGMLWATLVGQLAGTLYAYRMVVKLFSEYSFRTSSPPLVSSVPYAQIWRFTATISYILFIDLIVWQRSEVFFLRQYSDISQIAYYTLAFAIASKLSELGGAASSVFLPLYAETFGRKGLSNIGNIFAAAVKYVQMVMVPLCMLGFVLSRPLVYLLYGPTYDGVVWPLQLLLVSLAFTSIGTVGSPLLVGTSKQGFMARYGTAVAILNIILDLILIPWYGAMGAAIANSAAQLVGVIGGTLYILHYTGVRIPWKSVLTVYLSAAIAISPVAYWGTRENPSLSVLSVLASVGMLAYVIMLTAAGELGISEVTAVRAVLSARLSQAKTVPS